MNNSNKKKSQQLGMPHGTASNRLRKRILFHLIQQLGQDVCFQCGEKIDNVDHLSIEHKIPWLDNDLALFWDLENIAFSHLSCNCGAGRRHKIHPSLSAYHRGCRCQDCRALKRIQRARLKQEKIQNAIK